MMLTSDITRAVLLLLSLSLGAAYANSAAKEDNTSSEIATMPSLADFSRIPAHQSVSISPTGKQLVYIQNYPAPNNAGLLTTYDLTTGVFKRILYSDNVKTKIKWVNWANDDILLVSAIFEVKEGSTLYYQTRMFSVDTRQEEIELRRILRVNSGTRFGAGQHVSQFQDSVVDFMPNDPDHILMEVDLDVPYQPSVYKINVRTMKKKRIEKGKKRIRGWLSDQQNVARIGTAQNYDTGEIIIYERKGEDEDYRELFSYMAFDDKPIRAVGFALDPNILYFTKYKGDKRALYKMDLTSLNTELVLAHKNYDVSGRLIYSKQSNDVIGVHDTHSPFGRYYFDESDYKLLKGLDKVFPDTNNFIVDTTNNGQQYIVYREADGIPGSYYLGNRDAQTIIHLFSDYPELENIDLPQHQSIRYTTRDGIKIQAYLTLPLSGQAPYPTIMHPHGGPGARDYDGFDPWVAYMVNRGYAVIRPNFRGSTGFGYEFAQAQMGRWGLEMQDDLADAAHYLVEQGIADKSKFCIFGASYGGYAALMAAVKTPDLFTCAVSFAGVSDLVDKARHSRKFLGGELSSERQFGDDTDDLEARSPLYSVGKIKIPILLMHGKQDRSVPVAQSRDMAEELEDASKDFEYIEFETGDHHLSIQENRTLFFEELDRFLTQHLQ